MKIETHVPGGPPTLDGGGEPNRSTEVAVAGPATLYDAQPMPETRARTLVVLPTYQEADNIEVVLRAVRRAAPDAAILVVDDGSPDGTADIAEGLAAELGSIDVLRRSGKSGLGSAYRAGFAWGLERGLDVYVEMDSDLSHDPEALPSLIGAVRPAPAGDPRPSGPPTGPQLAIGSRYVPGGSIPNWRWHRRMLSRWGNRYSAMVLGFRVRDATSGYRAYTADALRAIGLDSVRADGYGFQIEMAYRVHRAGLEIVEVPISFVDRVRGESKMSWHIVHEALLLVTWWDVRDRVLRLGRRRG